MQYNKVEISGVNTNELKTLKESEKLELLKKAHSGDKKAREELINGNLRLVLSVLQKFVSRSDSPDDLFQVGVVGLIKAIDNFDTSLDVKFSTYAVPMIAGELRRFLRDFQPMRVSRSLRDLAYKAIYYMIFLIIFKYSGNKVQIGELYKDIEKQYGKSTAAIERSTRSAIVSGWEKMKPVDKQMLFESCLANGTKPTNAMYINTIALYIKHLYNDQLEMYYKNKNDHT